MFEIFLIVAGIILVVLMIPYLLWRIFLGSNLRSAIISFFTSLQGNDLRVDPEADIPPAQRQPISEVLEHEAEQFKQSQPLEGAQQIPVSNDLPQASIQATTSQQKPVYKPPYRAKPDTIDSGQQAQTVVADHSVNHSVIEQPVQPLVDDDTFAVDDPIIDDQHIDPDTPSADSLDANVPDLDSSPYGVRSSDISPGRRLRDKRYRRNSS